MRASAWLVFCLLLSGCVTQAPPPSASPSLATSSVPSTSAPPASPSAAARSIRPFDRVVALAGPADTTHAAVDRDRVAFVEGTAVTLVDVASGQKRNVHQVTPGWSVSLSSRGLRGDLLVLTETRTDGQRTDGRAIRVDLRTNARVTLDEWSGPYLGGGDTLSADPPITNGTDVVWTRITADVQPFAVELVLGRGTADPQVVSRSTSAAWADLHDDGRIAISIFITRGDQADLAVWQDGQLTRVGTRGIPDGGPARFVGDRLFWAIGPGFVARIERGQLITLGGAIQDVAFPGCGWTGATVRHLALACGNTTAPWTLLDPATGARGDEIPAFGLYAGPRAVAWREGTQWWLGILPP